MMAAVAAAPSRGQFDPFWLWTDVAAQAERLLAWGIAGHQPENSATLLTGIDTLVSLIEFLTEQDCDVGICEMMQVDLSNYVVAHHVQTVFLCGLIANRLGLTPARRQSLCRAAFTMNFAALRLHDILSRQVGRISDEQKAQMTGHGARGRALLERLGVRDEEWLRAVAEHHPEALAPGQTASELASIVHHADIYLAKISPRAYRPAKTADVAAKELLTSPGADRRIVSILIKEFGIYPPGSYVALANGETAIVARRRDKAHAPQVFALLRDGRAYARPLERDSAQAEFAITGIVQREQVRVSIDRATLFGYTHG